MTTATARKKFDAIRARYVKVEDRKRAFRDQMWDKYRRHDAPWHWQTLTEHKCWNAIQDADLRVIEQMCALLDEISPRDWRNGVGCQWLMTELTFEDAITAGPLSVIPPPPYGYTEADARRFAAAQ